MDLQNQMKKAVAQAAVDQIQNGMILGLGSGSTAALMIEALAIKIKSGDIITINLNKQTLVVLVNGFTKRRLDYKSAQEHYKIL